ncbi:hypothetical protein HWV62_15345 [Athelia sp. TMB]|nr:hypothetical protein HWV62_15345 [Athelia sp. TMB]
MTNPPRRQRLLSKQKLISKSERVMAMDEDSEPERIAAPSLKRKKPSKVVSSDESEDEKPREKPTSPPKKRVAVSKKPSALLSSDESEEDTKPKKKLSSPPKKKVAISGSFTKPKPVNNVKKKAVKDEDFEDEEESDDGFEIEQPAKKKPLPKKAAPKKEAAEKPDGKEKVKEEGGGETKSKFNWAAAKAAKLAGPSAHGSKEVPEAKDPMGLSGLTFVFTGELSSFSRDEALELAKRFGGRVTGQPSSKTSYVVLGSDAGPAKLAVIKKYNLNTLSEDQFLELIATREVGGKNGEGYDEKTKKKMEKDAEAIRKGAKELEQREKQAAKAAASASHQPGRQVLSCSAHVKEVDPSSQLWTTRYAPQNVKEICGNKGQVEKLQNWLNAWSASRASGFKKPGKDGMNVFRAVLITGPPGIGKTTSAHLCAKLAGLTPIEVNASDSRSKKLVESGVNMDNKSLDGWMGGGEATNTAGVAVTDKTCLIMDEVDGMSAGDRGGVGALAALIKKTKIPIICIANDRGAQKLKPLTACTFSLTFRKPDAQAVRSRIMTIAFKEKMKIPANVIDQLINGTQSDIRQVLNMLSTWRLSKTTMDFDEGKTMAKLNQKSPILTPFDVINKMLGPYMFSPTARETLGDKMELYFHDPSFVPLFVQASQENYLKTTPARTKGLDGPPAILRQLELMDQAATSISDGDLVDAMIHGTEQHWALMPLHSVCSTIRPASCLYGPGIGFGGPNAMAFPQWLGQNSKQSKLNRQLGDVQIRMRLKVSGDKSEIRQSYLPALHPYIVRPLAEVGASAVEEVIERMDEYFLSKEDWDTIVELGVDGNKDELVLKKISTATKTNFTRKSVNEFTEQFLCELTLVGRYNTSEHPIAFHKAQDLGKAPKKLEGGPAPDLEDAFEMDDEVPDASDDEKPKKGKGDDVSNDKLIKAKKAGAAKGKGKA